ncbi:hypothetical protein Syun_010346 [Stephania yunnanensis]|uniref:Uncharacterized protein n=1 Tax=Stephania yunnanensis TaxID=152371 RepID=A0AAP0KGC0_9MAGN
MPDMVPRAEFNVVIEQLRKVMEFMHQHLGMNMDGAVLSQQQQPPPPPPPHDQQQLPRIDPVDPPQQGDNVERETQEWLTRDEQLGDTEVQDDSDVVQEIWRRRDKADKGLNGSLRRLSGICLLMKKLFLFLLIWMMKITAPKMA